MQPSPRARLGPATSLMLLGVASITWGGVRLGAAITASDGLLVLGLLAAIADPVARDRLGGNVSRSEKLVVAAYGLLAFGLVVHSASRVSGGDARAFSNIALSTGCLWLVARALFRTGRSRVVFGYYSAGAAASAVVALAAAVPHTSGPMRRPSGLADHPNSLGIACAVGCVLALGLASTAGKNSRRSALALACVNGLGVLVSGSRAGIVVLLGALLLLFSAQADARWRLRLIVILLASVPLLLWTRLGRFGALARLIRPDDSVGRSDDGRRALVGEAVSRIREHPLIGSGSVYLRTAHSLPLQLVDATGALGLVAALCLCIFAARQVRLAHADGLRLGVFMSAASVGLFLALLVSTNVWDRYILIILLASAILSESEVHRHIERFNTGSHPPQN